MKPKKVAANSLKLISIHFLKAKQTMKNFQILFLIIPLFFVQISRVQAQPPVISVLDPVTGNEAIYSNPFAPGFHFDLRKGLATFPSRDYSREESLSIDQYHNGISELLSDKELLHYMDVVPSQLDEIIRIREQAIDEFALMIEEIKFCDDPRFPEIQQKMDNLSKKMIDRCESVMLPHQKQLRDAYKAHLVIWAEGGALNSLLDGTIWSSLDEESKRKISAKKAEVAQMIRQQMSELEKKAIEELLKDVEPATQQEINAKLSNPPRFVPYPIHTEFRRDCWNMIGLPSFSRLFAPSSIERNHKSSPCPGCG